MRIEKVNDNQIRCTLTKEDLNDRKIKVSELAYGSDKAKILFRDMMQQASFEFGFETENTPLMIEAIPVSNECIVLIVTKVEDPEEFDTRFSKFAPSVNEASAGSISNMLESLGDRADDVLDLFKKLQSFQPSDSAEEDNAPTNSMTDAQAVEETRSSFKEELKKKLKDASETMAMIRIYSFDSLNTIISVSKLVSEFYHGANSLYKDSEGNYLLSVSKSDHNPTDYNKVCNVLAEYGNCIKSVSGSEAFLAEHHELLIQDTAIADLSLL